MFRCRIETKKFQNLISSIKGLGTACVVAIKQDRLLLSAVGQSSSLWADCLLSDIDIFVLSGETVYIEIEPRKLEKVFLSVALCEELFMAVGGCAVGKEMCFNGTTVSATGHMMKHTHRLRIRALTMDEKTHPNNFAVGESDVSRLLSNTSGRFFQCVRKMARLVKTVDVVFRSRDGAVELYGGYRGTHIHAVFYDTKELKASTKESVRLAVDALMLSRALSYSELIPTGVVLSGADRSFLTVSIYFGSEGTVSHVIPNSELY
ncbi:MAG: uncharacterized protein A8A55_0916 [Amphiamblys sp. WSBS2006]|nr:MAG: uncharacterized protein A8A55_0916 [Amphiamblys sp. WSBS2006]